MIVTEQFSLPWVAPNVKVHPETSQGDSANDWLCAWCLNRVANEKQRFVYEGQTEFSFTNPDGIRFHILIFSQAPGCLTVGEPNTEHTWFPGYAWSYCVCDRCRMHLGWQYSGVREFIGLIRDRIIRASIVRN